MQNALAKKTSFPEFYNLTWRPRPGRKRSSPAYDANIGWCDGL